MATINFPRLSVDDAEEVIAEIWNCLEEYRIPSPRLKCDFRRGGDLSLECQFGEAVWAKLIALRLSAWIPTGKRPAVAGRGGPEVVSFSILSRGDRVAPHRASHLASAALRQAASVRVRAR